MTKNEKLRKIELKVEALEIERDKINGRINALLDESNRLAGRPIDAGRPR